MGKKAKGLEKDKDNVFFTLWYGAAKEISSILRTKPKYRALQILNQRAKRWSEMSISGGYKRAIKDIL